MIPGDAERCLGGLAVDPGDALLSRGEGAVQFLVLVQAPRDRMFEHRFRQKMIAAKRQHGREIMFERRLGVVAGRARRDLRDRVPVRLGQEAAGKDMIGGRARIADIGARCRLGLFAHLAVRSIAAATR